MAGAPSFDGHDATRRVCGVDWTASALAEELLKNADMMRQSGGGVTFSGGEPLAQAEFLLEVFPLLNGVSVAIETSGQVAGDVYRAVVSRCDFVYQDLKHHDDEAYRRWCAGELETVLANVEWLKTSGVAHAFRVPVIPGVNDAAEDREAFIRIAGDSKVEFLPYNPAAGAKYPMLGREYPYSKTNPNNPNH